jgi:hypothetical protein
LSCGSDKEAVSAGLTEFFSDLTLELKGVFFTFSEMRYSGNDETSLLYFASTTPFYWGVGLSRDIIAIFMS